MIAPTPTIHSRRANTFYVGPNVFEGGATVRQSGGSAGTDEIQITHDGSQGTIDCKDGNFTLKATFGDLKLTSTVGMIQTTSILQPQAGIRGYDGKSVGFAVPGDVVNAAALKCPVAKVLRVTDNAETGPATFSSVPITPSQITGNQDNYGPGVARFYRLSTDASRNITGLSVGQVDGQECELWNVGSFDVVLVNESSGSTAANRFTCPGSNNVTLSPGQSVSLRWFSADQSGTGRWRVAGVGLVEAGWSVTAGYTADRALDPESTTLTEVARVLGTLIDALKAKGLLGG